MNKIRRKENLEIYKLHAELADRVSQRREGAHRLHVSLLVGLVMLLAALLRFGSGDVLLELVQLVVGIGGASVSLSWAIVIRSYNQLNSTKYRVLQELETNFDFPYFTKEWYLLTKPKSKMSYWRLTQVERILPGLFGTLSMLLIGFSLYQLIF